MNEPSRSAQERPILVWLATEAAAGEETALRQLLERLKRPLTSFLGRSLSHPEDVRDAWQETALAISAGIGRLRDANIVRAWAFKLARNKVTDLYRQRSKATLPLEVEPVAPGTDQDRTLFVRQSIATLDRDDQDLIYAFYHLGFSINEIAASLDIKPGAVRVRLFRARSRLKTIMQGDDHE